MRSILLAILLLGWSVPASAAVEIHFYSKDLAKSFPHGFVRLTGTLEPAGQAIDVNYGFTPVRVAPAILMGPVKGKIQMVSPRYVERSVRHFSLKLDDAQYRTVMAVVEQWRGLPQPSYLLNSRNCVHFVAAMAEALGLKAPAVPHLMKKPKSFLQKVTADNMPLIANWNARQIPSTAAAAPASK